MSQIEHLRAKHEQLVRRLAEIDAERHQQEGRRAAAYEQLQAADAEVRAAGLEPDALGPEIARLTAEVGTALAQIEAALRDVR